MLGWAARPGGWNLMAVFWSLGRSCTGATPTIIHMMMGINIYNYMACSLTALHLQFCRNKSWRLMSKRAQRSIKCAPCHSACLMLEKRKKTAQLELD
jgi:hypothetical protein